MCKKASVSICLFSWDYMINYNESEKEEQITEYDINGPTSRHGLTYTNKHKTSLNMMMLICLRQHPTNTWGSIYEKVEEHWG